MIKWLSILWEYDDLAILSNVDILPQIVAAVKYKTCKN